MVCGPGEDGQRGERIPKGGKKGKGKAPGGCRCCRAFAFDIPREGKGKDGKAQGGEKPQSRHMAPVSMQTCTVQCCFQDERNPCAEVPTPLGLSFCAAFEEGRAGPMAGVKSSFASKGSRQGQCSRRTQDTRHTADFSTFQWGRFPVSSNNLASTAADPECAIQAFSFETGVQKNHLLSTTNRARERERERPESRQHAAPQHHKRGTNPGRRCSGILETRTLNVAVADAITTAWVRRFCHLGLGGTMGLVLVSVGLLRLLFALRCSTS